MKIHKKTLELKSKSQLEFIDITNQVDEVIASSGVREGQVLIFSTHTSAAIIINHNEPMLLQDFSRILYKIVPVGEKYAHDIFDINKSKHSDGRSNGHAHCKTMLLSSSQTIPVERGRMLASAKQSIIFVETDGGRSREVIVQVMGI